jgi:hypothetical protein
MFAEQRLRSLAFLSLLRDEDQAIALSRLLEGLARSEAETASVFLVPAVRGVDFFASAPHQAEVDHWWAAHVPADAVPVYLLHHEPGLAAWLRGLDGHFLVAAAARDAAPYTSCTVVDSDDSATVPSLAEAAVARFSRLPQQAGSAAPDVFDRRDWGAVSGQHAGEGRAFADRSAAAAQRRPWPVVAGDLPPLFDVAGTGAGARVARPVSPDPIELLAAESALRERTSPLWPDVDDAAPLRGRTRAPLRRALHDLRRQLGRGASIQGRSSAPTTSDAELAALLVGRPGRVVVVGSRKGGVGKTSHAAGMAIAAGVLLDTVGHSAALVDANIANPDAWGQLRLPAHAATVRDVVTALTAGAPPPPPLHSATPALACYPERREGVEYGRNDIRRLATHLRARHTLVVVDMSNRLPDPTGGPEAAVASYWLEEADALVLPTAMSRQDFNGVLDYLDVGDLPPTVVPCIVSGARRNRRHPMTLEYLELIASRVERVVEVPDEADRVRLAGMDGVPVQDVSPKMRGAYRQMVEAVAQLSPRSRA